MKESLFQFESVAPFLCHVATSFWLRCNDPDNEDGIRELLETIDLESVLEDAYSFCLTEEGAQRKDVMEALRECLWCLNHLESETTIQTPIPDELYDKILELVADYSGEQIIGNVHTGTGIPTKTHQYPELRGSLKKVHFATRGDVPKNDTRKSLEEYLAHTIPNILTAADGPVIFQANFKYDGNSAVFECHGNAIVNVLTRYDTKQNLGKDITHIFKGHTVEDIFGDNIPKCCRLGDFSYGIQVELVVLEDQFYAYQEYANDKKCNHRSAVSSIANQTKDKFDPELQTFLIAIPLQIASEEPVAMQEDELCGWYLWRNIGTMHGKSLLVSTDHTNRELSLVLQKDTFQTANKETYVATLCHTMTDFIIPTIKRNARKLGVPIDGAVLTAMRPCDTDYTLRRIGDKNEFQVAFKFPAGVAKTTVKKVEFKTGPLGYVSLVAEFEPVTIGGNTLTHVNLSNMRKLERLCLHPGDEILVRYDIVPTIATDETCKKATDVPPIQPIDTCPTCGEPLQGTTMPRCVNINCVATVIGRIYNYTKKMGIPGFGIPTIESLYTLGALRNISDLYRLKTHEKQLAQEKGYGDAMIEKLLTAPLKRTTVFPHELLGAIGIPGISSRTMQKVCRKLPLQNLINAPESIMKEYPSIPGIGEKLAAKLADGLEQYKQELLTLLPWFTFKSYEDTEKEKQVVMWNGIFLE